MKMKTRLALATAAASAATALAVPGAASAAADDDGWWDTYCHYGRSCIYAPGRFPGKYVWNINGCGTKFTHYEYYNYARTHDNGFTVYYPSGNPEKPLWDYVWPNTGRDIGQGGDYVHYVRVWCP